MNKKIFFLVLFLSVLVINVTGLVNGERQHETWHILVSSISLGLLVAAASILLAKTYKGKRKQLKS